MVHNKLNVILLCRSASYQGMGGPVWSIRALLKEQGNHLKKDELSLSAVLYDGFFNNAGELAELRMETPSSRFLPGSVNYVSRAVLSLPRFTHNLNTAIKAHKRNIILHSHDFVSAYLSRWRFGSRFPLILTIHAKGGGRREVLLAYPILKRTPVSWLTKHIENTAVSQADMIVFPSSGARELFTSEHPGLLDNKEVRVVHAGIEIDTLLEGSENPAIKRKYGISEEKKLLISVAAMLLDKGLDTLVEAIGMLPGPIKSQCCCIIVGREGPLKEKLEYLIKKYNLQNIVNIVGFLPRQDLIQLIRHADLFALPSRVAIFDVVLLEAAALGTAVVTSAVGGNLEIFDSESAFFVPPDNPQQLTDKLAGIILDDEARRDMGARAQKRIKRQFSIETLYNAYVEIYKELTENK
ncbi:glycosyltransferase family 4 protein [Chloroflexota bacterium]